MLLLFHRQVHISYRGGCLFTLAILLDLLTWIPIPYFEDLWQAVKEWIIVVVLLIGTGYLGYTAHLGANLVYKPGAGVYQPTEQCTEFE